MFSRSIPSPPLARLPTWPSIATPEDLAICPRKIHLATHLWNSYVELNTFFWLNFVRFLGTQQFLCWIPCFVWKLYKFVRYSTSNFHVTSSTLQLQHPSFKYGSPINKTMAFHLTEVDERAPYPRTTAKPISITWTAGTCPPSRCCISWAGGLWCLFSLPQSPNILSFP